MKTFSDSEYNMLQKCDFWSMTRMFYSKKVSKVPILTNPLTNCLVCYIFYENVFLRKRTTYPIANIGLMATHNQGFSENTSTQRPSTGNWERNNELQKTTSTSSTNFDRRYCSIGLGRPRRLGQLRHHITGRTFWPLRHQRRPRYTKSDGRFWPNDVDKPMVVIVDLGVWPNRAALE